MTAEQTPTPYTPCFDWVVRATGSSSAALAYGVIWRYAHMRGARCYASCERLSGELGWTRQCIMRHIQMLLAHRLLRSINLAAVGVPREYVPVSEEEWDDGLEVVGFETEPAACDHSDGPEPATATRNLSHSVTPHL